MIDKKTMSRVKYKKTCSACDGREVKQEDIVKGYEYEEGKYVIFEDKDFEKILQNLYKSGMGIVIRTSDPNINISMLESIIGTGRFPIKILKYRTEKEMAVVRESADSGIISKGKTRPLLETLYRCDRAGAVIKSGLLLEVIAFVVGIIAALLLSSFDALGSVSSLHIALYHIFWSVLVWILTVFFV
jgi:hypothetical protein